MKLVIAVTSIILGLGNANAICQNIQDMSSMMEDFSKKCNKGKASKPKFLLTSHFSPVRKVIEDCKRKSDFWCYEHLTPENQNRYRNNTEMITEREDCPNGVSKCAIIRFYSAVRGNDSKRPRFIWHVISVPRPSNFALDGYMIRTEEAVDSDFLGLEDDEYKLLLESKYPSERGDIPVYLQGDEAELGRVRDLWERLVGTDAWDALLWESTTYGSGSAGNYDHTFYNFEFPDAAGRTGSEGWRHVSQRTAMQPGTAYGFVLDSDGRCLASDKINLE